MKKKLFGILLAAVFLLCANATVLFPHFVDIAPNYEKGNAQELVDLGVDCGMYHSTTLGFMTSTFTEVENFFKDTLPNDVKREERTVTIDKKKYKLVVYSTLHVADDTIKDHALQSTIYVLQLPNDSFKAVYCEKKVALNNKTP